MITRCYIKLVLTLHTLHIVAKIVSVDVNANVTKTNALFLVAPSTIKNHRFSFDLRSLNIAYNARPLVLQIQDHYEKIRPVIGSHAF